MRSQEVIKRRLGDVSRQIRETAETATDSDWHKLHIESETLRWVLNVPTEKV